MILSIALRTEVIVYKLNALENLDYGITKTISLKDSKTLQDISMFGWINISYIGTIKEILEIKGVSNNFSYSEGNPAKDLIFFL